jgi:hypothetical protein
MDFAAVSMMLKRFEGRLLRNAEVQSKLNEAEVVLNVKT